jgi:hypothetical protein
MTVGLGAQVDGDGGLKSKDKKNTLLHDVNSSGWDPDMDAAELIPFTVTDRLRTRSSCCASELNCTRYGPQHTPFSPRNRVAYCQRRDSGNGLNSFLVSYHHARICGNIYSSPTHRIAVAAVLQVTRAKCFNTEWLLTHLLQNSFTRRWARMLVSSSGESSQERVHLVPYSTGCISGGTP